MKIQKVGNDHVIYGDWDDVIDDQFMIYYHPNEIHCIVFILSGFDYGGGINKIFEATEQQSKEINKILDKHGAYKYGKPCEANAYDVKKEIMEYIENCPENQK